MRRYRGMEWKYIRRQPKRSLQMVISLFLSAMLLTMVGAFYLSVKDSRIALVKQTNGDYHGRFDRLSEQQAVSLEHHPQVSSVGIMITRSKERIANTLSDIQLASYTEEALKMLNLMILSGRYPGQTGEIAIEEWALASLASPSGEKPGLQSQVELSGQKWTVVGILKNQVESKLLNIANAVISANEPVTTGSESGTSTEGLNRTVFVQFPKSADAAVVGESLVQELDLTDNQFRINQSLLDAETELLDEQIPYILLYVITYLQRLRRLIIYFISRFWSGSNNLACCGLRELPRRKSANLFL